MVNIIMRAVFVLFPAILVGLIVTLITNPEIGMIFAAGMIGLGLECTSPKKQRGEGDHYPWD